MLARVLTLRFDLCVRARTLSRSDAGSTEAGALVPEKGMADWPGTLDQRLVLTMEVFMFGRSSERNSPDTGEFLEEQRVQTVNTSSQQNRTRWGLALSGGGFRAALYHVGVLAALAELDILRRLEVISTVSGGSIIGAMYYLKLRNLLQTNLDHEIDRQDYLNLITELDEKFYDGVRRNLRTRTLTDPIKTLRMCRLSYSRSDRMADLYTSHFYAPCVEPALRDQDVPLSKTVIQPMDEPGGFHPLDEVAQGQTANNRRTNKVPVLLINATTLNTGHNFRFTSTWMGETRMDGPERVIDQNMQLKRVKFRNRDVPDKYRKLQLGVAVAASSAVPAISPPLALTELYPDWTPQLVDGGVHDNQGVQGLIDNQCTDLIISDASGQMSDQPESSAWFLSVLKRSNSIMMDRVRELQYGSAEWRRRAGSLNRITFFHMRQGLSQPKLRPTGIPTDVVQRYPDLRIDVEAQSRLSKIRTDLDSFSEVEAFSLMAAGYQIALAEIPRQTNVARVQNPCRCWRFLQMQRFLEYPAQAPSFQKQLEIAGSSAFKLFLRWDWLKWTSRPHWRRWRCVSYATVLNDSRLPNLLISAIETVAPYLKPVYVVPVIVYALLYLVPAKFIRVARHRTLPQRLAINFVLATAGCIGAWLHIKIVDRIFLWQGKLDRLE